MSIIARVCKGIAGSCPDVLFGRVRIAKQSALIIRGLSVVSKSSSVSRLGPSYEWVIWEMVMLGSVGSASIVTIECRMYKCNVSVEQ